MKALVLGTEGMLGHKMLQALRSRFEKVGGTILGRRDEPWYAKIPLFSGEHVIESVNAMNTPALESTLAGLEPEVIVNCVGIIKQREEARAALPSIAINSLLPHQLAHWAAKWGGRVIHFSTDCVFDGTRGGYTEDSPSDAEDLYGKSKYLGEVASKNALTLRTSIIGRELASFASLLLDSFDVNYSSLLRQLEIPVLVIASEAYLPVVGHEREYLDFYGFGFVRQLQFRRLAGTGHYLMLEKPTALASLIIVWLRSEDP